MFSEEKITALLAHFKVKSVKQLEVRLGLSNGYISNLQKKGTENPGRLLVALNENGISTDWFFSANNDMVLEELKYQPIHIKAFQEKVDFSTSKKTTGGIPLVYESAEGFDDGIVIPLLENSASAGNGADLENDDTPVRYVQVPRHLSKYPHLASLPVKGDSMEPTLHDGDIVVCDGGGWDGDGIYVLKTFDSSYVKRVQITTKGYEVISDNQMYKSFTESKENLSIVGKVRAILVIVPGRRGGV